MNAVTDRRALQLPLDRFDVSDPGLYQAQTYHAYFDRLRREDPLHWCADSRFGPYWSITRYKDIMAAEVNHQVFSSELGGIQVIDQPKDMTRPSFIRMDPPKHDEQRKVVQPIVAPGNLANMEPLIRERTQKGAGRAAAQRRVRLGRACLDRADHADAGDALRLPVEERRKLTYWSDVAIADITDPDAPVHSEEARFAELKVMAETMAGLFNERKERPPGFDLLSMLAHGAATREMPFREFMGNLGLLIVGGNDTTRNSMSGGLLALSENPAEWDKLRADPGLIPNMVSEMIRWVTPVIHMRRTASRDFELHGKTIREGDKVVMWYVSGNRDPEAIEEPDRFIIDRPKARQHLSFGFGVHRCVGNRLAELQLRILWEEVLARFPRIEVLGEAKRTYSNFIHGIRSLPVRIPG